MLSGLPRGGRGEEVCQARGGGRPTPSWRRKSLWDKGLCRPTRSATGVRAWQTWQAGPAARAAPATRPGLAQGPTGHLGQTLGRSGLVCVSSWPG
jgi:hypothetical protein